MLKSHNKKLVVRVRRLRENQIAPISINPNSSKKTKLETVAENDIKIELRSPNSPVYNPQRRITRKLSRLLKNTETTKTTTRNKSKNENQKSVNINKNTLKNSNSNENNKIEKRIIEKPLQSKMKFRGRILSASCDKDVSMIELKEVINTEENRSNESQEVTILPSNSVEVVQNDIEPRNEKVNAIEVMKIKEMRNSRNKNISNEKSIDIVSIVTLKVIKSKEDAVKLNSEYMHESNAEQKRNNLNKSHQTFTEGEARESMAEQLDSNDMNESSDEKKTDYDISGKELKVLKNYKNENVCIIISSGSTTEETMGKTQDTFKEKSVAIDSNEIAYKIPLKYTKIPISSLDHAIVGKAESSKNLKDIVDAIELTNELEEVIKVAEVNQENNYIDDETEEVDEKSESNDTMHTKEWEYLGNNEISDDEKSIDSKVTELLDSFIVLSENGEENNESDTSEESENFFSDFNESDVVSDDDKKLRNSSKGIKRIESITKKIIKRQLPKEDAVEADITNERQILREQKLFITPDSDSINELENDNERIQLRVNSPSSVEDDKELKNTQNKKNRSESISSIHSNISFADQDEYGTNEDTTIQQMFTLKKDRKVKKDNLSASLISVGRTLVKGKKENILSLSSPFTYNLPRVSNSKNFEDEHQTSKSLNINEVEDENKYECSDNSSMGSSKKIHFSETFIAESNSEDGLSTNDNIKELHENSSEEKEEINVDKTMSYFTKKSEKSKASNIEDDRCEISQDDETKKIKKSMKKRKSISSERINDLNKENISSYENAFEKENKIVQKTERAKRKKIKNSEKMKKHNLNSLKSKNLKAKQVVKGVKYGEFLLKKQKMKYIQAKKKDAVQADEIMKESDNADAFADKEDKNVLKSEENSEPKCITSKKMKNKPQKLELMQRKRQSSESNINFIETPFGIFYLESITLKSNTENKFKLEKNKWRKRKLLQDELISERDETYKQNKNFIQTPVGIFCEEAISPISNEKKKLKMTTVLELPIGTVYERSITPTSQTPINGFIESDATPSPVGFKVESILSAEQQNVPVQKKKKSLKLITLNEPKSVLPKPIKYAVTKIRVGEDDFIPLDIHESNFFVPKIDQKKKMLRRWESNPRITELSVAPLKSKTKCSKGYGQDRNIVAESCKDRACV